MPGATTKRAAFSHGCEKASVPDGWMCKRRTLGVCRKRIERFVVMTDMNSKTVVLGMARTPFGKLGGALAPLTATTLGAVALTAAVERSRIDPSEVEHV